MATGRTRGKNHLPRLHSREGIRKRQELRLKAYERVPANIIKGFHRPGSANPRKLCRS